MNKKATLNSPLAKDLLVGTITSFLTAIGFYGLAIGGSGAAFFIFGGILFGVALGCALAAILAEYRWVQLNRMSSRS